MFTYCHKFLVIMEHCRIVSYLVNVNRMICLNVDIGISITLITNSGVNLNKVGYSKDFNFRSTISENLAQSALLAFTLVKNPNLTILSILFAGSCLTETLKK